MPESRSGIDRHPGGLLDSVKIRHQIAIMQEEAAEDLGDGENALYGKARSTWPQSHSPNSTARF